MKKALAVILVLAMVLSFCGCGVLGLIRQITANREDGNPIDDLISSIDTIDVSPETDGKDWTGSTNNLTFISQLDAEIYKIYISPTDEDEWGDPVYSEIVYMGDSIQIPFSSFEDSSAALYDFGLICGDRSNYDVYEIPIARGDTLILTGDYDDATLIIQHADGSTNDYEVSTYYG